MICIVSGKNLRTLCKAMERLDMLDDPRFAFGEHFKNQPLFLQEIESWSSRLTTDACEHALNATGVPCSRYNSPEDLFDHPQIQERQSFTEQQDEYGAFLIQNAPFKFTGVNTATSSETPSLGEHTDRILAGLLKYSAADIERLRGLGAIG
jgi:crotonobetainyl-CoA:carnitine CoA-transferase CaiB-like acyl-CoA transferase